MKIAFLHAWELDTFNPSPKGRDKNFIGDEAVSIAFSKYLLRNHGIECGRHIDSTMPVNVYDVAVELNYRLNTGCYAKKNIWYCQNGFPEGSEVAFENNAGRYDGIMIAGRKLYEIYKDYVTRSGHKPIYLPVATDVEDFKPLINEEFTFDLAYCGNDTKGDSINSMLKPCLDYNFALYGRWLDPFWFNVSRGQISMDNLVKVYSSTKYLINIHYFDCLNYGLYTGRLYDIMACNGVVITDNAYGLDEFLEGSEYHIVGDKGELKMLLSHLISKGKPKNNNRKWIIKNKHTYEDRAETMLEYIKEIL